MVVGTHEGTPTPSPSASVAACGWADLAPDGKPRFVLDIEPVSGTVTVGPHEWLAVDRLTGIRLRWCGAAPSELTGTVQLRAHGAELPARAVDEPGTRRDRAPELAYGVAPGQAAVLYDGTRVGRFGHDRRDRPGGAGVVGDRHRGSAPARARTPTEGAARRPGELPADQRHGLPHLPELPARGAVAAMTGRAPGWSPSSAPTCSRPGGSPEAGGLDQRRTRSLLAQDLDAMEEQT